MEPEEVSVVAVAAVATSEEVVATSVEAVVAVEATSAVDVALLEAHQEAVVDSDLASTIQQDKLRQSSGPIQAPEHFN